jgi:hypothetical protein
LVRDHAQSEDVVRVAQVRQVSFQVLV